MRPIPLDPLNPGDDGLDENYIEDPNIPGEVPTPTIDDEVRGSPEYPGEQDEDQEADRENDNLLDPEGDASPNPHAE